MYVFRLKDEAGDKYRYKASDLRMALVVHHQKVGTEIVKATRVKQGEIDHVGQSPLYGY